MQTSDARKRAAETYRTALDRHQTTERPFDD